METNTYQFEFIGRQEAINAFHSLRSLKEQKNVLYIEAEGGLGKTRLLREYVQECKRQRRPWYTGPVGVDPLIDFYDLENRTMAGLQHSIVRRIGEQYFPGFLAIEARLFAGALAEEAQETARARLAALRREAELLFFRELKSALREVRNYTVLFFDTFEIVHNRDVGRWFLTEFLPNPATTGSLIVFAGRPRPFDLPLNSYCYELKPFEDQDVEQYFQQKWDTQPEELRHSDYPESQVIRACQGRPLLLDLLLHYLFWLKGSAKDMMSAPPINLEEKLVARFWGALDPLHEVIRNMAYLKRRYNQSIFEQLRDPGMDPDYNQVAERLMQLPFIKHRPGQEVFTLHDEFQRMFAEHGGREYQAMAIDLYQDIVLGWYNQAIMAAAEGTEKNLLRAEQLAYILENDRDEGLNRYREYFAEIRANNLFDFNDMLWGEVAGHLRDDHQSFDLVLEQANWLFESGRRASASFWFEQLLDPRFATVSDPASLARIRTRLGHCHLSAGELDSAQTVWQSGLEAARQTGDLANQASFVYNLAHLLMFRGQWEKALENYTAAVELASAARDQEMVGEALFVMARLRARQGHADLAKPELQRGLQLVRRTQAGRIRHVQALVYAGDVYRYAGDHEAAKGYYDHALRILEKITGWPEWRIQALAGLGAAYNRSGARKREEWDDLEGDVKEQAQAYAFFRQSLGLARQQEKGRYLGVLFDRLADLYLELHHLETQATGSALEPEVQALASAMHALDLFEEQAWQSRLRDPDLPFARLDTLAKAQRLFEIALHESDRANEPHLMFDALAGAAAVAQRRGRAADLHYYSLLATTMRGLDDPGQEKLFVRLLDILQMHLEFERHPQYAIERYAAAVSEVAAGGSFGLYLLSQQLPEIQRRILSHPPQEARTFTQILKEAWRENPELFAFIRRLEDLF